MQIDHGADFETVPIIDMEELSKSHECNQAIIRLRDICHHIGFFYIKNHGISTQLIQKMLKLTEVFFNLPQTEKETVRIALSPHYRGYGRLQAEVTQGIADYKETYDLGLEQTARVVTDKQPYLILQGPNQWPTSHKLKALRWRETILQYISLMQKIGEQLMGAMSLALGFPEDYFVKQYCSNAEDAYAILRLLRYPPGKTIENHQEPVLGVGPHTDLGCLVILLQDEVGGLQVQNSTGKWINVPPIKDTFVLNIGEMLQLWSNNYFLATSHRVINSSTHIRHSVPFFFEPNLTAIIKPQEVPGTLLAHMNRPKVKANTSVLYGEHMLNVYQRSFQLDTKKCAQTTTR